MTLSIEPKTFEGCELVALVRLVTGSSVLQERLGVDSQEAVAERVFWPHMIDPDATERPFVVITQGDYAERKIAGGQCNFLMPEGTLSLWIADNARHLPNAHDSLIDFTNFAGGLIKDIKTEAGGATNSIVDIERVVTHQLMDKTKSPGQVPYWWGEYMVRSNPIG